jgi:hypothetical protein
MWFIPLALLGALLLWFLRKRHASVVAPAKAVQHANPMDGAETRPVDVKADSTPEQKWRQSSQQAVKQAERGDWHSYARTLQALADQLCDEGSGLEAISIFCRVLFVQINGPVDGAPFTGNGFVTDRVYDRMIEFAGVAGLDTAGTRAQFIAAAGKIHRRPMPLSPPEAWEAISANRSQKADEQRQQRAARDAARRAAEADQA